METSLLLRRPSAQLLAEMERIKTAPELVREGRSALARKEAPSYHEEKAVPPCYREENNKARDICWEAGCWCGKGGERESETEVDNSPD